MEAFKTTVFETVKVTSGIHWRLQNIGNVRALGYLPRRAEAGNRTSVRGRERVVLQSDKVGRSGKM